MAQGLIANVFKRSFLFLFSILIFIGFPFFNANAKSINIGLIQVIEHPALDRTRQGIMDELNQSSSNLKFIWESAQGKMDIATQIAQKFLGDQVDLIIGLGTIPAQAALAVSKSTPVVFSSVTDPQGAKLIREGRNKPDVFGVSNFINVNQQLRLIKKILPSSSKNRIGIIYNPGEDNSVTLNKEMQRLAETMGLMLVFVAAPKTCEVCAAAQSLIGKVDAVFVNNDSTALAAFEGIAQVCLKEKIPLFVSDIDSVEKGAIAAIGADQYELGRQTTRMIIQFLKGQRGPDTPAVEYPNRVETCINLAVAEKIGFVIPQEIIKTAERLIPAH